MVHQLFLHWIDTNDNSHLALVDLIGQIQQGLQTFPVANKSNDYLIDRARQRSDSFTGIRGIREQDLAVQEDQWGTITDRTKEHLGSSDTAVIAMRRLLLRSLDDLARGVEPYSAQHGDVYRVRSSAFDSRVAGRTDESSTADGLVAAPGRGAAPFRASG